MKRTQYSLFLLTLSLLGLSGSGCGLVDSAPPEVASESIEPYYFDLKSRELYYSYTVQNEAYGPQPVSLEMEMEGEVANQTYNGKKVYTCDWVLSSFPDWPYYYYYAYDRDTAYALGTRVNPTNPVWMDLVAPIREGATWTFQYGAQRDTYTAKITRTGFSTVLTDDKGERAQYKDVIEVIYQGPEERVTKWFARDVGMIFEVKHGANDKVLSKTSLLRRWHE